MKQAGIRTLCAAASFCITLIGTSANAHEPTNWGTYAETLTINCISPDCSGGGVSGGDATTGPIDDQVEAKPASSTLVNPLGDATVTSDFVTGRPGVEVFQITGSATSVPGGSARATGEALAYYWYGGGAGGTTLTITATLSGTFSGPLSGEDSDLDGLIGRVLIFTHPLVIDEIDLEEGATLGCLGDCYEAEYELNVEMNAGVSILSDSMTIPLAEYQGIYLHGYAYFGAAGGGTATSTGGLEITISALPGLYSILPASGDDPDPDADGDGIPDSADNCIMVANADQRDTNGDGHGNMCDFDYTNNCIVNFLDLAPFSDAFGASTGDANFDDDVDLDGNGVINFLDFGAPPNNFAAAFTLPPGPSSDTCTPL